MLVQFAVHMKKPFVVHIELLLIVVVDAALSVIDFACFFFLKQKL